MNTNPIVKLAANAQPGEKNMIYLLELVYQKMQEFQPLGI